MIKLPKDLLTQGYTKPKVFLCEVDKKRICQLDATNLQGTFKFNAYSEISFTVGRVYTNTVTGKTSLNPFYDKIEALRLIELEGFGYFEIQDPEINSDGIQETKSITAYSLEYTLSQKYIEGFNINTGENNSVEVVYANGPIVPVTLYNPDRKELSLLHIILEKVYGWEIGHIDESLKTMSRTFEISRVYVYDFIMQDICDKFNCYVVFDTMETNTEGKKVNKINIYAEALITKRRGDGITTTFYTDHAYKEISSVSIDSCKTTEYTHTFIDGGVSRDDQSYITFMAPPIKGAAIEIIDGSQLNWITDVYVSFQNLAREIDISYSADDIKTVLTVKGADDLDIREVNMGLPYLVDISYYCNVGWMGQDLYDAYLTYSKKCEDNQQAYVENSAQMIKLTNEIHHEQNRISLQYVISENVGTNTVGTYYIKGTDAVTGYDSYKEVVLPDEFNANVVYYTLNYVGINEEKFNALYSALQSYFMSQDQNDVGKLDEIKDQFKFLTTYTIDTFIQDLSTAEELAQKNLYIYNFLEGIWPELGYNPLNNLYYKPYKLRKDNAETDGWNDQSSENYWQYYPVTLVVTSIETAMNEKKLLIDAKENDYTTLSNNNKEILESTTIVNNFTPVQQAKLSSFLREDEYTDDNFFITDYDTPEDIIRTKQELLQCGRIELQKLCSPKLSFSMDMANIYAIPEFDPIVHNFDLGKLINIEIRPKTIEDAAYVKQARLLQVDFNFEDFSDFSCEFGELTSLRTPSSIHADLLATALTAGKSVASNASYWNKGIDIATSTQIKIQQGLLGMGQSLYTSDQSVVIDNDGIRLRRVNEDGTFSPYQAWIKNNTIVLSDNGFAENSTPRMGLGEFTVDGTTFYGILAEAVLSGYIEGSTMVGGKINIGDGAFVVHEDGTVVMNGNNTISGYAKEEDVSNLKKRATIISSIQPTETNEGQLWLNTSTEPYELMVFTHGKWVYFAQQDGQKIYTSQPSNYAVGDLWILAEGEIYTINGTTYKYGNILRANEHLQWEDATPEITKTLSNIEQYFEFNKNSGLKIGQKDEKFYVNISSTRMSFYDKSNGEDTGEQKRDPDEVVYISNKSAVMKKLIVEDDATFESHTTFKQEMNVLNSSGTAGFTWKIEANGSLSLAIQS